MDDVEDNRDVYAQFLRFSGVQVHEASDGLQAILLADRIVPDVIVLDLSMPGLDGFETCKHLKAQARTAHVPVIALTGMADPTIARHAARAGCAACLTKPCLPEVLLTEIRRHVGQRPAP